MDDGLEYARGVCDRDSAACERFVGEFSGLVLSRIWELAKTHCERPARECVCSLLILQRRLKGASRVPIDQCDDCMDSYLWFFDSLKNKLRSYRGECGLGTYVFAVVHSRTTYIEWLRWKYGRAF